MNHWVAWTFDYEQSGVWGVYHSRAEADEAMRGEHKRKQSDHPYTPDDGGDYWVFCTGRECDVGLQIVGGVAEITRPASGGEGVQDSAQAST